MRKACAHAFYKERLHQMTIVIKQKVNALIKNLCTRIDASSDNQVKIEITSTFKKLFFSNTVHIICGEDITD